MGIADDLHKWEHGEHMNKYYLEAGARRLCARELQQ